MRLLTGLFRLWPALLPAAVLLLPPDTQRHPAEPPSIQTVILRAEVQGVVRVALRAPEVPVYALHPVREGEGPLSVAQLLSTPHGGDAHARIRL